MYDVFLLLFLNVSYIFVMKVSSMELMMKMTKETLIFRERKTKTYTIGSHKLLIVCLKNNHFLVYSNLLEFLHLCLSKDVNISHVIISCFFHFNSITLSYHNIIFT